MTTTFDRITHTYGIEIDGIEYETTFKVEEYIDPKVEVADDDKVTITYATHDEYHPWNPLEDDEFIQFQEFRSEDERNDWAAEMLAEGWVTFFVNHYEHSASRYSVIHSDDLALGFRCANCSKAVADDGLAEGTYLCGYHRSTGFYYEECEVGDDGAESYDHEPMAVTIRGDYRAGWDDRPSGVIALNPAAGFSDIFEAAKSSMEVYTYWVNGEVYSICTETYVIVGDEAHSVDYDIVGGYFGSTETEQLIASGDF